MNACEQLWVGICGGCCAACVESLNVFCLTKKYGSGNRGTQAGCCGSCCNKSFDEDDFAPPSESRKPDADGEPAVNEQPVPQNPMSDKHGRT